LEGSCDIPPSTANELNAQGKASLNFGDTFKQLRKIYYYTLVPLHPTVQQHEIIGLQLEEIS
jgi:hypothetical protein